MEPFFFGSQFISVILAKVFEHHRVHQNFWEVKKKTKFHGAIDIQWIENLKREAGGAT
jgi:hypothetical protein